MLGPGEFVVASKIHENLSMEHAESKGTQALTNTASLFLKKIILDFLDFLKESSTFAGFGGKCRKGLLKCLCPNAMEHGGRRKRHGITCRQPCTRQQHQGPPDSLSSSYPNPKSHCFSLFSILVGHREE